MSRSILAAIASLGLAVAALVLAPTALAGDPCFHSFDNRPPVSSGSSSQVALGDCAFTPTVNQVAVGTTVTWRNASSQAHEIVGSNLTWGVHDKLLPPGATISWTFETAGVYAYSCMLHPGMTGTIVVGDAAALASSGGPVETPATSATGAGATGAAGEGGYSVAAVGTAAAGGLGIGVLIAALVRRRQGA